MTTTNQNALSTETTNLSAWHLPSWDGPTVERRPEHANPAEWPEGAVERVTFTREAFPNDAFPECLPFTEHFGADGWPLGTPDNVKSQLDQRMQAEFRREPWTYRPESWVEEGAWLRFASSYEDFLRREAESAIVQRLFSFGLGQ